MARDREKLSYHQRIIRVLASGGWHSLRDIYKVVARFIPPDTAEKEYRKRHSNAEKVKVAERVAQGRKRLIFLSLNSAIHHRGIVVARGSDWDRKYRLTRAAMATRRIPAPKPVVEGVSAEVVE